MITLYCWNNAQKAGLLLNPELLRTHAEQFRNTADVHWIDLFNPTEEEERLVLEHYYSVHKLTRQDITRQRRLPEAPPDIPKVEGFPDYLFVISNPLSHHLTEWLAGDGSQPLPEARLVTQLNAILTSNALITHHVDPSPAVENLRTFLAKHEEQAGRGPDYLFHLVLDAMVDEFAPVLDRVHDRLDTLEEEVFRDPTPGLLAHILMMKKHIIALRKTLVYQREVLARLVRGDFTMIDEREIAYYRNVYDHIIRFTELIEGSREMVYDLVQTHMSVASNKLNEIMKVLTMISTVGMVCTVIGGIYGMNFDAGSPEDPRPWNMPELRWAYGYPMALTLMAGGAVAVLAFFRWKKWL